MTNLANYIILCSDACSPGSAVGATALVSAWIPEGISVGALLASAAMPVCPEPPPPVWEGGAPEAGGARKPVLVGSVVPIDSGICSAGLDSPLPWPITNQSTPRQLELTTVDHTTFSTTHTFKERSASRVYCTMLCVNGKHALFYTEKSDWLHLLGATAERQDHFSTQFLPKKLQKLNYSE